MTENSAPDVIVPLTLPAWEAERLTVLVDPDQGLPDLEAVVYKLADHMQQGVYRRGAWEREWLCQAFGYDWLTRVEPDPDSRYHDRPRGKRDGADD